MNQADDRSELASIWRWRFGFYDRFGHPGSVKSRDVVYDVVV
ncbi:hypothetical protein [Mycobacteroides abscessus]|nr:hypothetical protein [Mycobacteroides abscessus]SIC71307.1 Uncharacterised protein [Mycobacteroides abscessus subsp. abscessus]